jgi:hypothetical protein
MRIAKAAHVGHPPINANEREFISAISKLIYDSILSGASSAFFDFTAFRSECALDAESKDAVMS